MKRFMMTLGLLLLVSGCQTSNPINTDYDSRTDFGQYRSFSWAPNLAPSQPALDNFRQAFQLQLLLAGLDPSKPEEAADLLVAYQITDSSKPESSTTAISIGHHSHDLGFSVSVPLNDITEGDYKKIVIELIDTDNNQVKWQGSTTVSLSNQSPERSISIIESAIAKILASYPPH